MIRHACTWLLIVLAASPFTAPFSTCDARALLGSHASMALVMARAMSSCVDIVAASESGDAASISPIVERVVLSRDAALVLAGWPVSATPETPLLPYPAPAHYHGALEDSPDQSPVLRL
jgi:hypothetical protein